MFQSCGTVLASQTPQPLRLLRHPGFEVTEVDLRSQTPQPLRLLRLGQFVNFGDPDSVADTPAAKAIEPPVRVQEAGARQLADPQAPWIQGSSALIYGLFLGYIPPCYKE